MSVDLTRFPARIESSIENNLPATAGGIHWTRGVAASSLIASALLLIGGRRKSALAVATAAGAIALLENPEAAQEFFSSIPRYLRNAQDLLVKTEDFINQLAEQGGKLRQAMNQVGQAVGQNVASGAGK